MTAENFAAALPFACLAACLFRARLLALALVPPCALIALVRLELVDTSSASHPLRWVTPVLCAALAGLAAWWYTSKWRWAESISVECQSSIGPPRKWRSGRFYRFRLQRALVASLLVLGSCAPDLLALHPFFWARFEEWPLVPVQIAVCATILAVLLAPERWVKWIPM